MFLKNIFNKIKLYLNFFIVNQIISKKIIIEYKINLINALLVHIIFIFTTIFFGFVFIKEFGPIIELTISDYFLFQAYLTFSYSIFVQLFLGFKKLKNSIIQGDLNLMLTKPLNIILFYILKYNVNPLLFFINLFTYIGLFFYFGGKIVGIFPILISILILILISINLVLFYFFMESFSLFFLNLGLFLRNFFQDKFSKIYLNFPFQVFEKTSLNKILLFIPIFFISYILIDISKGIYNLQVIIYSIIFLSIFSAILIILIKFQWKYGLKRYEAFG